MRSLDSPASQDFEVEREVLFEGADEKIPDSPVWQSPDSPVMLKIKSREGVSGSSKVRITGHSNKDMHRTVRCHMEWIPKRMFPWSVGGKGHRTVRQSSHWTIR